MKKWAKNFLLLTCSLASLSLYAGCDEDMTEMRFICYDTYFGVNYKYNWTKPKGDWNRIFPKTHPGFDVYAGWRFLPNFGIELGYDWTSDKPKSTSIPAGTTFLGVTNPGPGVILTGKVRFKTGHADLNYFLPFKVYLDCTCENFITPEVIFSFGIAATKTKLDITANEETPFSDLFTGVDTKSKAIFRAGLGIQTLVIENVGLRALARYETTSTIRVRNDAPLANLNRGERKIFKDTISLSAGIYFTF